MAVGFELFQLISLKERVGLRELLTFRRLDKLRHLFDGGLRAFAGLVIPDHQQQPRCIQVRRVGWWAGKWS
jgi:hypothetical protein